MFQNTHLLFTTALLGLTSLQPVLAAAPSTPTGGIFTAGLGAIQSTGNTLTINQSTLRGVINWNNFSLGPNGFVIFNGSGATLNRVSGVTPTSILGHLLASGSVYILNPSGILIGNGATVHTGADFLASTLNLSNDAFLNSGSLLFHGLSNAAAVNLGQISSSGGVYLMGHRVTNAGSIATSNGAPGLAAGHQVLITDSSTDQRVFVQTSGGDVTNSGFIRAAQVELKSNGGNIYALAGNNGGQINAAGTTTQDGHVWLIAANGTAGVSGIVSAVNSGGAGGAQSKPPARMSSPTARKLLPAKAAIGCSIPTISPSMPLWPALSIPLSTAVLTSSNKPPCPVPAAAA
jgi:filamentous hemagglutinin family protein